MTTINLIKANLFPLIDEKDIKVSIPTSYFREIKVGRDGGSNSNMTHLMLSFPELHRLSNF